MIRVNTIPRTLVGAGGVRLYNFPGVIYPDSVLTEQDRRSRGVAVIMQQVPKWGISTREAADVLGCLPSSARSLLHREHVRHCRVAASTCPPVAYWDRRQVHSLAVLRQPVFIYPPLAFVVADEVRRTLGISRNTMIRYVKHGQLHQVRLRVHTSQGARIVTYYLREEVSVVLAQPCRVLLALGSRRAADVKSAGLSRMGVVRL